MTCSDYYTAYEPDLRCFPNYSFEVGDLDGDGRMEMVCLNQNGNRLRAAALDGRVLFEVKLNNNGNWGTPLVCVADLNGDGRLEVIVPDPGPRLEARIRVLDALGRQTAERRLGAFGRDDYGIAVPLLATARLGGARPAVVAALAGGQVVAMDGSLNEVWRAGGFRNDFGHEFCIGDLDGDGLDEIVFCTLDHINGGLAAGWNEGELVVLDHDGRVLLRRPVLDYCRDTHFDDMAIADFRGVGRSELLLEKGFLLDAAGGVVWGVAGELDHGQWIAHCPDPGGRGRLVFISELWGTHGKSTLFSGQGRKLASASSLPWTKLEGLPGWRVLPTRAHVVQWRPGTEPEIFLAEQACSPTSHDCFAGRQVRLQAFFLSLDGTLRATMPFDDAQVEGYWYNGEVHSRVADVDGDGRPEIVFPRQCGRAMVIKKR